MDFNIFAQVMVSTTAGFLILAGLVNQTKNFRSSIIYKVIPFFLGICNLYIALRLMALI